MAKNADVGNFWHIFAIFRPLTGSKLRFGGSYVKIGQELASEMHFLSR